MNLVLTQLDKAIGTLTLNRPEKLNSISAELADDLIAGLDLMEQAQVRVVILRAAAGVKVWSAGFDINELPIRRRDPLGYEDALERLLRHVQDFPSPIIDMVEGSVWGLRNTWNRKTENLYSAWVAKLFDAPLEAETSWKAWHEVLRDRSLQLPDRKHGLHQPCCADGVPACDQSP